jgi:hypothetical protein
MTGSDANPGTSLARPKRTIKAAVEAAAPGTTVFVESGDYTEINPVNFPERVSLVGDNLRRVDVRPSNPTLDVFHCRSGCYVTGITFRDHKAPSYSCAFPAALARATVGVSGTITGLTLSYSPTGYSTAPSVWIEPPFGAGGGTQATATATISGGVITGFTITNAGSGYDANDPPWVSIPHSTPPSVTSSPYIQNCSSITGPFDTSGNSFTQAQITPPYDINNVAGTGRAINPRGAGGGIRVDGQVVAASSPLNSFVADAFTQINQGGPGHLLINRGYGQFVSCFTTFSHTGYETRSGAFANVSNSVIDFGIYGLRSSGYYPVAQATGTLASNIRSTVAGFTITEPGSGYASVPTVTITGGGGSGATATAEISVGTVTGILLTNPGSGYTSAPTVAISAPGGGGVTATAVALLNSPGTFTLNGLTRRPDVGTTVARIGGAFYSVVGASPLVSGSSTLTVFPGVPTADAGVSIPIFDVSLITSGSLVTEYAGSGVTYNALPKFGGVPIASNAISAVSPGRVYYATISQDGNFSIGPFFSVEQSTGTVTISSDNFNLAGLNFIGPFRRSGVAVGVQLQEVSNNADLRASTGAPDGNTAPTQFAVVTYLTDTYTPLTRTISTGTGLTGGGTLAANRTLSLSAGAQSSLALADTATQPGANISTLTNDAAYITQNGNARVAVKKAGTVIGTRRGINLIEGSNVTLTVSDDSGAEEVDITVAVSAGGGLGTVTSVAVSGGTTGLTTSGGPITTSGTITIAGTLALANGGTGATTAVNARTALEAAALGANTFTGEQNIADQLLTRPFIKDYAEAVTAPTISGGTLVLNLENGNVFDVSLNANITTLTISNPPASGRAGSFTLILTADGTARTVTWGAAIKWPGGTAPTLTSTSTKKDMFVFATLDGGTTFLGVVAGQNF